MWKSCVKIFVDHVAGSATSCRLSGSALRVCVCVWVVSPGRRNCNGRYVKKKRGGVLIGDSVRAKGFRRMLDPG